MTSYRTIIVIFFWLAGHISYCQDTTYAREVISYLCNQNMHGRGYLQNGDKKAADYIRKEFEANGVQPLGPGFFQTFRIDVNTFPGAVKISLDGTTLIPGHEFIIDPASPALKGKFIPVYLKASEVLKGNSESLLNISGGRIIIADARELIAAKPEIKRLWNEWKNLQQFDNPFNFKALIEVTDEKLNFGASTRLSVIPFITVKGAAFQSPASLVDINIKNKYFEGYETQNVAGFIPGTVCSDSFLVFTAHYDHLGMMGKGAYFPGANDNASGTAMMLGLARYFSHHPPRCSVVFIGFTGEEAGLLGSRYFVDHPLVNLSTIKFLVNLDLVGTGIDGITVVNATEFPDQFEKLSRINEAGRYIGNIKKRGKACNSDHCPFYVKGVPCFFIYTLGGIAAYHDLDDRPETLPLTAFQALTKLLIEFGEKL